MELSHRARLFQRGFQTIREFAPIRQLRAMFEHLEGRTFLSGGADVILLDDSLEALARTAHAGAIVVMFDRAADSASSILKRAADLAEQRGEAITSLSILSHGDVGRFQLGSDTIDAKTLASSAAMWRDIGNRMTDGAGVYIFSCSTAAGKEGLSLITQLSDALHHTVFASTNLTGMGGDWALEASSGSATPGDQLPFDFKALSQCSVTLTVASGSEFQINTTTANTQSAGQPRAVAADFSGNYVVTWESYGQDAALTYGIYAQRYNAAGVAQGSEFLVNSSSLLNDQRNPAIAMNAGGDFVIAWEGTGLLGVFPGIYAQRYNSAGVAQGSEIAVDGSLLLTLSNASVAMDSSGNFVVAYEGQDASGEGIFARRYDSTGAALGASFAVNTTTTANNQRFPSVAISAAGGFIVAWSGQGATDTSGIYATIYDSSGVAQTGEIAVNSFTTATQTNPVAASLSSGAFIVIWSGRGTGDTTGIWGQLLTSAGALSGSAISVNVTTAGTQQTPSVATDSNDDFLVVWAGNSGSDSSGIVGREFKSDGTAKATEFQINTTTSGTQANPSVISTGNNGYIVTWDGNGTGDGAGIAGQGFVNDPPVVTATSSTLAYTENDTATVIDSGLTVTDSDDTNLTGATVTIGANYVNGEDVLAFTDQLGITGSWSASTGILTLSGTTTVANYRTALRSITYVNSSENPSTSSRAIWFVVTDGTTASSAATRTISITAVNDAPSATTTSSSLAYTENDGAVVLDSGISLSDVDSSTLSGATITISSNYVNGEDTLSFTTQSGISGSWSASTGILTLTGTASLAAYQTALRSITYANSSDDPSTSTRTMSFVINDGSASGSAATRNVTIAAVNDAPVVTTTSSALAYTENDGAVAIDSALTITDADNTSLTGATITISGNYVNGEDTLSFTTQSGISGSWSASTGILTLTGAATVAAYRTALRSITYTNGSDDPSTATRTISFVVTDGSASSSTATRSITITAVNDAPTATTTSSALTYTENDGQVAVDSGLTLSDLDSTTLTGATITISGNFASSEDTLAFTNQSGISGSWSSSTGILTLTGTATLAAYQAALRTITYANGSDNPSTAARTITFVVNDGSASSTGATRSITITAVNDPPAVATTGSSLSYTENDGAVIIDSGLTTSDVDSTTLSGATISITGNYVNGEDLLAFTNQSGISGSWSATTGILTLSGAATIAAYQAALRSITYANVSDDPSTATRTISFVVNDGAASSSAATRSITITPVNDAPTVATTSSALTYTEGDGQVAVDIGLTLTDPDNTTLSGATITITGNYVNGEDVLAFTNLSGIAGSWSSSTGTLTLTGAASLAAYRIALRTITYENGSDNPSTAVRTITFIVSDGSASSTGATRSITIVSVNNPPAVATTGTSLSYTENDGAIVIDGGVTTSDIDSTTLASATISITGNYVNGEDTLAFTNQSGISGSWNATTGTLTLTGTASLAAYQIALRSVTYTNTSDDPSTATRTVSFIVNDGSASSSAATRSILLTAVNDAPTIATTSSALGYTENAGALAVDSALTLADLDDTTLAGATITISGSYINGEDVLAFTNQSGISGIWNASTGTLTLSGTATIAVYRTALRSIAYANLSDNPSTAARTVSFVINDGAASSFAATRTVNITPVNDPPVVNTTSSALAYSENAGALAIDSGLTITDADNTALTGATIAITTNYVLGEDLLAFSNQSGITGIWNASTGTLTLSGTATIAAYRTALRSITYTNLSNDPSSSSRVVSFVVSDGADTSAAATRTINITAVNDAPIVNTTSSALNYTENDGAVAIDPGLSITDVDSPTITSATITITMNFVMSEDSLTFIDQSGISGNWNATSGALTLTGTATLAAYQSALRSITYTNGSDYPTSDAREVRFVVSDGAASSAPTTRLITITLVNDAPALSTTNSMLSYTENAAAITIDDAITASDIDNTLLAGAVISISGNYAGGEDLLTFTDQSGISGFWNASTGTLTLSGSASVAAYQNALRSVAYLNISDNPSTATRVITFTVTDGSLTSTPATRSISITPINDAPTINAGAGSLSYTENAGQITLDTAIALSDPDSTLLSGALFRFDAGFMTSEDALAFTDQLGITGIWDQSLGVLTLSGNASLADYQTALRSITYINASDNPSTTPRHILLSVSDGFDISSAAAIDITITPVNDAPIATASASALGYTENAGALTLDSAITLSDVDDTLLTGAIISMSSNYVNGEDLLAFSDQNGITGSWDATTGTLTLSGFASIAAYEFALRSITYTNLSDNPSTAARGISFVVSDSAAQSAPATRSIQIIATNDAAVINISNVSLDFTENDGALLIDPNLTLTDIDGSIITGATITINGTFVGDLLIFTDQSGISGTWDGASATLTLSGTASISAYESALLSIAYINTSDNPSATTRTFTILVDDGVDQSLPATRDLQLHAVNDAPFITTIDAALNYTENAGQQQFISSISLGDLDDTTLSGATITFTSGYITGEDQLAESAQSGITASWDASTGTLTLVGTATLAQYQNALQSIFYTNTSDNPSTTPRTFSIEIRDAADTGIPAAASANITAVNDAPIINTSPFGLIYDISGGDTNAQPTQIDTALSIADVDSTILTSAIITISSGYISGVDALLFTNQSGITGSFNAATGVLTLTGAASLAEYQSALQSVRYLNTAASVSFATRIISFSVSDGQDQSSISSRNIDLFITGGGDVEEEEESPFIDEGGTSTSVIALTLDQAASTNETSAAIQTSTIAASSTKPAIEAKSTSTRAAGAPAHQSAAKTPAAKAQTAEAAGLQAETPVPAAENQQAQAAAPSPLLAGGEQSRPAQAASQQSAPIEAAPPTEALSAPGQEQAVLPAAPEVIPAQLTQELAKLHEQLEASSPNVKVTGTTVAVTAGSVGMIYVTLAARAGVFSAAMLTGTPVWGILDPATVLKAHTSAAKLRHLFWR